MNSEVQDSQLLAAKVQELQKEIRRIKQLGIGASVLLVGLVLLLQVQTHRKLSTEQVVAKDLVVTDSLGRARARLGVFPAGSGLEVYAASGEGRVQLLGGGEEATLNLYIPVTAVHEAASVNLFHDNVLLSSFRSDPTGARLELHSETANGQAVLSLQGTTASLLLSGTDQKVPKVWLSADPSHACTALSGVAEPLAGGALCLHAPGLPSLELADALGNRAVIGIPQTPDLSAEGNSAASMILKHKNGNKLRVAPR